MAHALSMLDDHESAIQTAEYYLRRVPSDLYAYTLRAMVYAFAGDKETARATIRTFRGLYPSFTLRDFIVHEPYRDQQDLDRVVAALREAGLPE